MDYKYARVMKGRAAMYESFRDAFNRKDAVRRLEEGASDQTYEPLQLGRFLSKDSSEPFAKLQLTADP